MNVSKTCKIAFFCLIALMMFNPTLRQHRPVAMKHIRKELPNIIESELRGNIWIPNWIIDKSGKYIDKAAEDYTQQLAGQLERKSYLIFSVTKLHNPQLKLFGKKTWVIIKPKRFEMDRVTSFGILGMVF